MKFDHTWNANQLVFMIEWVAFHMSDTNDLINFGYSFGKINCKHFPGNNNIIIIIDKTQQQYCILNTHQKLQSVWLNLLGQIEHFLSFVKFRFRRLDHFHFSSICIFANGIRETRENFSKIQVLIRHVR